MSEPRWLHQRGAARQRQGARGGRVLHAAPGGGAPPARSSIDPATRDVDAGRPDGHAAPRFAMAKLADGKRARRGRAHDQPAPSSQRGGLRPGDERWTRRAAEHRTGVLRSDGDAAPGRDGDRRQRRRRRHPGEHRRVLRRGRRRGRCRHATFPGRAAQRHPPPAAGRRALVAGGVRRQNVATAATGVDDVGGAWTERCGHARSPRLGCAAQRRCPTAASLPPAGTTAERLCRTHRDLTTGGRGRGAGAPMLGAHERHTRDLAAATGRCSSRAGSRRRQPAAARAELYDPVTNTWSSAGTMLSRRASHTGDAARRRARARDRRVPGSSQPTRDAPRSGRRRRR